MTDLNLPKHVAIIMDGNGRWAQARGKNRTSGHKVGVERAREAVETAVKHGVEALTLFAFSSENWNRPADEVNFLMELFIIALGREVKSLHKHGVKLKFIGDTQAFNQKLQKSILEAEALTQANQTLQLNIAANYGGRWDIVNAVNQLQLNQQAITEKSLEGALSTVDLPPLDLMIRTGGEKRISNFLIWQAAYAELYFCDTLWPDFDCLVFEEALQDYANRQRRFGLTGAQVTDTTDSSE